jgi:hypothetical protein
MKKSIVVLIISFLFIRCSQSEQEIKKQSLDDVYFYLSNYNIVKDPNQIRLVSFKNIGKGERDIKYEIKNNKNLWIIHYYDEKSYSNNFFYNTSSEISKRTDSINTERRKNSYYPLSKRWDWVGKIQP